MINGFTVVVGKRPPSSPALKITKHGIFINATARHMLGLPTRVQVGLDEPGHRLAICPVTEGGIALSSGYTGNKGVVEQVLAVFGEDRVLEGHLVEDGMMFGNWEDD